MQIYISIKNIIQHNFQMKKINHKIDQRNLLINKSYT
jgi:hypothetical protein